MSKYEVKKRSVHYLYEKEINFWKHEEINLCGFKVDGTVRTRNKKDVTCSTCLKLIEVKND